MNNYAQPMVPQPMPAPSMGANTGQIPPQILAQLLAMMGQGQAPMPQPSTARHKAKSKLKSKPEPKKAK